MNLKLTSKPNCAVNIIVLVLTLNSNAIVFNLNSNAQNFTFIYRDYLRNMMGIADHEVPPCENFFQHACGNFKNFQKLVSAERETGHTMLESDTDVEPFLYNKQDHYRFFETHKQVFNTTPGILVRKVYDLCKCTRQQVADRRRLWRRLISDIPFLKHDHERLRKWPFLQYQWDKYEPYLNLSWPVLAAEFSAHGLNTFLNVFFAENTIYVAPNDELQCPDRQELGATLLPLLGKRNTQIADIVGGELWLLCNQLKGEVAVSGESVKVNLLTDDTLGEFFLQLFFRLNFTDHEIEKARKVIIYIDKLSEAVSVLRYTNPRIVYNFILWQAYQQTASVDDCFELTHEFANLLQVEYWNWHAFEGHLKRDVAMALYLFHATRFQKRYRHFVTSTSWERLFQNHSERKDLNIERSIKNYAKQYLDLEGYANIFESPFFSDDKPTFHSLLFELRRLKIRFTFINRYEETEDLQFFHEFVNFTILLLYRPRFHYFASYGREMWQNSKLLRNSDGLYTALDCLSQQIAVNADDSDIHNELSMELINDIFNFYTAFVEALSDYKFWLESENFAIAEDFILQYFELNSTQVMFYAVAQQFCNRNDLLHKTLINRSYMNMPQFEEAFKCMPFDDMNPTTKCMINKCL